MTATSFKMFKLFFLALVLHSAHSAHETDEMFNFPLLMPEVKIRHNETYLCTAYRMPKENEYIIGFEPNATMGWVHHILIYGCMQPGYHERDTPRAVWDCGEMAKQQDSAFVKAPTCKGDMQIVYAWARDAPPLNLPPRVGFKVGGDSGIRYMILQVHYGNIVQLSGRRDSSGVILHMIPSTANYVKRRAGVYLLGTAGMIEAKQTVKMETACEVREGLTMFPFAFRTHTHNLGHVVSGWRVRNGQWTLIGRKNPLLPQMFYNVSNPMKIQKGDILAARCTMVNTREHDVAVGNTNEDEMCNFYIMYYVEGDDAKKERLCFSPGPPLYSWKDEVFFQNGIPKEVDIEASRLSDER